MGCKARGRMSDRTVRRCAETGGFGGDRVQPASIAIRFRLRRRTGKTDAGGGPSFCTALVRRRHGRAVRAADDGRYLRPALPVVVSWHNGQIEAPWSFFIPPRDATYPDLNGADALPARAIGRPDRQDWIEMVDDAVRTANPADQAGDKTPFDHEGYPTSRLAL